MSGDLLRMDGLRVVAESEAGITNVLVHGANLILRRGEVLGLIGESGAGKSTIGLAALAYTRPGCVITDGGIWFDGIPVRDLPHVERRKLRGRRIAYVAQSAAASFNPVKSLLTQVCEMPIRHGLMNATEARRQAIELFRELDLPSPELFGKRYPHQVSGGQLQRAMLAMAMSCRPDILVFDEPTTALDVTTQIEVLAAIRKLIRDHRTAGLYISHDLAVVAQIADRVMVLRNGRIVESGATETILHRPQQDYTQQLVSMRTTDESLASSAAADSQPILELENVSAAYGSLRAVKNVTLDLHSGETVAVVGESGSGKSTLARTICGLRPTVTGRVRFRGEVLSPNLHKRRRDQLRRIQMIYQMPDVALNPRHRIGEILGRPLRFYFGLSPDHVRTRVAELLEMIDLSPDYASRRPGELSGGEKQRICIARALAAEPDIVICDEVTSSLDSLVGEEILRLLAQLQRDTGVGYLFITHDLGIVRRVANRVAVMRRGEAVAQGPLAEVFAPPYHDYTELLLSSVPELRVDWLDETLRKRDRASNRAPLDASHSADAP